MFDFFLASLPILFILFVNLMIKVVPWAKDQFDIMSGGTYSELHDAYSVIFAHMSENPDQWKFGKDSARYPKSGGIAIISISKENDHKTLQIAVDHINGGRHMQLKGYFNKLFRTYIRDAFNFQSSQKTAQVLFPDNQLIMLSDESKVSVNNDFMNSLNKITNRNYEALGGPR